MTARKSKTLLIAQRRNLPEYDAYLDAVSSLNEKHGLRIVNDPDTTQCIEGSWEYDSLLIIEFEDRASAEQFYNSAEYQALVRLRDHAPPMTLLHTDEV